MTKRQRFLKAIGLSASFWRSVLRDERNLGYENAITAGMLLNTDTDLWQAKGFGVKRRKVFNDFLKAKNVIKIENTAEVR